MLLIGPAQAMPGTPVYGPAQKNRHGSTTKDTKDTETHFILVFFVPFVVRPSRDAILSVGELNQSKKTASRVAVVAAERSEESAQFTELI